ncbi:MAG: choline dehydrogenase [Rhodospirillaceae bacterium]|nr:dehydrogenase [Rhodospirillaceae bacterium]RPF94897.1 MAG: choline dehydrogenase [Rhodospirillaceae bacterium TMED63]RZO39067.1 MAG: choline dehydrogenase [Rhodospirillaceae bacterium]
MTKQDKFDYIIVGAGSAGCTLAGRLTEDPSIRVLLLEAGGWDRDPWIHIPLGWGRILQKRLHDWMYFAEPSATMDGRRIECARGKVIGGSSSINAMAYYHGHPTDYDRWAATGLPGWSYADVLPYFRRSEDWEGGADTWRGAGGPLTVRKTTFEDPLCEAFLDAARDAQYPFTEDYNGEKPDGFTWMQATLRHGRRWSAAAAYLHPALKRPNLTVKTKALVQRIEFDGERAIGIRYGQGGPSVSARAECEVILSGGTINSPQLLMLSGIGDPAHLRDHGIDVVMPLRGVGQNLADHTSSAFIFRRHDGGPFQRNMRFDRVVLSLVRAYLGKGGFAADLPFGITGFLKTTPDVPAPDIQMLFWMGATTTASPWLPPFKKAFTDSFSVRIMPMHPTSRGHVALASSRPEDAAIIHQNFFGTEEEWETMRRGLRMARELVASPRLKVFGGEEIAPGADKQSDAEIDTHIRATMGTVHHPVGTCKMGPDNDPEAVVDGELRVRGVDGLRVVDASVMPDLIGGATNAPVIMMGEKAADMILGKEPLPPADV